MSETDDGPPSSSGSHAASVRPRPSRSGTGSGRRRSLNLGRIVGDDRLRTGLGSRQRAAAGQDDRGARRDGARDRDRRAHDGRRRAARRARRHDGRPGRGGRARAEAAGSRCPSFTTHIFTGLGEDDLDSGTATARAPITEGTSVMFDFGGVVDGYCSDFGRTIYCGEPPDDYREVYDVMLAAQEAGREAAPRDARARGQRRVSRADRGRRPRRALPPPHGPRHRHGRPRAAVHLSRGRDAAAGRG